MPEPTNSSRKHTFGIVAFFVAILLLVESRGVTETPILSYLKDKLHLSPGAQSTFLLVIYIPWFVGFLGGTIRDRWRPFGLQDRGILLLACPLVAAVDLAIAIMPISYGSLLAGALTLSAGSALIYAAVLGQMADTAHRQELTGTLATTGRAMAAVGIAVGTLAGGMLADSASHTLVFLVHGALFVGVLAIGLCKPKGVYEQSDVPRESLKDWTKILQAKPLWLALGIWALWTFAPAQDTPLYNFSRDGLHLSNTQFASIQTIQQLCFFPPLLLYGFLCRRVPLKTLLWVGTVIGVIQWVPIMFIHSYSGAVIWGGVFVGLTGGLATGAYYDLILRACPQGFSGFVVSLALSLAFVTFRVGDNIGANIYEHGGFTICAIATTVVYALIFLLLLPLPARLISRKEGPGEFSAGTL